MSMTREQRENYYQSHEWGQLKLQVHDRAHHTCERCGANPIDAVHHLTYQRLGREKLEDLQGLCRGCHDFTHGAKDDPLVAIQADKAKQIEREKDRVKWMNVAVSMMSDPTSQLRKLVEQRTRIGWDMMDESTVERDKERRKITDEMHRIVTEEMRRREDLAA